MLPFHEPRKNIRFLLSVFVKSMLFWICIKGGDPRVRYGNGYRGTGGLRSISKPRSLRGFRDASGQLVLDHDEENLSEKELYARNIPAIGNYFQI